MTLGQCLELIPRDRLLSGLRDNEDGILSEVRGRVLPLIETYRFASRFLFKRHRFPIYEELPSRLRMSLSEQWSSDGDVKPRESRWGMVGPGQYSAIRERMEALLKEAAQMFVSLAYDARDGGMDTAERRDEKVERYRRQNKFIERRFAIHRKGDRSGPKARPVYCRELKLSFRSARDAAYQVMLLTKRVIRRSDIRTAITNNHACGFLGSEIQRPRMQRSGTISREEYAGIRDRAATGSAYERRDEFDDGRPGRAAYRLAQMFLRRNGRLPLYEDLPARLRMSFAEQFAYEGIRLHWEYVGQAPRIVPNTEPSVVTAPVPTVAAMVMAA